MSKDTQTQDIMCNGEVVSRITVNAASWAPNILEMHWEFFKWSPEVYKESLMVFEDIKENCRQNGIEKLVAVSFTNNTKIYKWASMMGIETVYPITMAGKEYIYLEKEI